MFEPNWHVPDTSPCANTTPRRWTSRNRRLSIWLLAGLFTLLLVGCGASPVPQGIAPSEGGNFVLRVNPTDADAVVLPDGFATSQAAEQGSAISQSSIASDGFAEKRFDLEPGSYSVQVSKSGYRSVKKQFEIPSGEPAEEGAEDATGEVVLEVALEPAPSGGAAGGGTMRTDFDLRGNPDFELSSLSDDQRLWYDRFWASVNHPNPNPEINNMLDSDDEYKFARTLFQHNHALLLALRATGDLRFLDEVDRVAQKLRNSLDDSWCGGVEEPYDTSAYGSVRGKDGYLNFRRRRETDMVHYCRDIADLEETLMHGHLAMVMYAYHANRDLESPSGIDYGERADFWLDYLRNHFEAKWRERSGAEFPEMDFIKTKFCHTHNQFTLYHYFIGKRLAEDGNSDAEAYLNHAKRMTDEQFDMPYIEGKQAGGFVEVDTPRGPAVVYRFGGPHEDGGVKEEACPTTYARYAVEAMMELNFEGFYRWADDGIMTKLANGIAHFVMDEDPIRNEEYPFAASVGGTEKVGGVEPTTYRDRLDSGKYLITAFPLLGLWDDSGKIVDISLQAHEEVEADVNNPRHTFVSAAMLVINTLQ